MNMEQWGLDPRDTSRAAAALQADETVELVVKPRAKMDPIMVFLRVGGGLLLIAWLLFEGVTGDWALLCALWVLAVLLLISPRWHRRRMAHTLYLLTSRRALVLEPGLLWAERTRAYPLHPNPVQKVERYGDGYGDIVLGYEMRWSPGHIFYRTNGGGLTGDMFRRRRVSVGFMNVPQVDEVYALFSAQVAAAVPDGLPAVPVAVPAPVFAPVGRRPIEFGEWETNAVDTTTPQALMGFGTVISIIAAVLLAVGIMLLRSDRQFDATCVKTQGTVVSVRQKTEVKHTRSRQRGSGVSIQVGGSSTGSTVTTYYPTLCFTDSAGDIHYYESDYGNCEPGYYTIGQQLTLRYLPSDPTDVRIEGESNLGMLLTVISSLVLVIGGGLLAGGIMMRKK